MKARRTDARAVEAQAGGPKQPPEPVPVASAAVVPAWIRQPPQQAQEESPHESDPHGASLSPSPSPLSSPSPSPSSWLSPPSLSRVVRGEAHQRRSVYEPAARAAVPATTGGHGRSNSTGGLPAPLRMVRSASFGVYEPLTPSLFSTEDDEEAHGGRGSGMRTRLLAAASPPSVPEEEEESGERDRNFSPSSSMLLPAAPPPSRVEDSDFFVELTPVPPQPRPSYSNALRAASSSASASASSSAAAAAGTMSEEQVMLYSVSTDRLPSAQHAAFAESVSHVNPNVTTHIYRPLVIPRTMRLPEVRPPRVFHSFLLISLSALMSVGELCSTMARVCKQWQRAAHDALAHPSRRGLNYSPPAGGSAMFIELRRLSSKQNAIRQRMDALMSSAIHATLHARHALERAAHNYLEMASSPAATISAAAAAPVLSSSPPLPIHKKVSSNQVPSVTLLQHLQLLPEVTNTTDANVSESAADTNSTAQWFDKIKRMLNSSANDAPLTRLHDSHCLLLSTHLVHLRVLRIYNGGGISSEGIKLLAHQLRHLRILHIGHLSDERVGDAALGHVSECLTELHSLWLTQDTALPQRSIFVPHPRIVYNLFSNDGVEKLKRLHRTLHHLNLGGFRNLTTQGVQLLSNGLDKLHLQSVHLNGWHIGDECMALLRRAHAQSLYHLHLFDAGVTNKGLAELARLDSLETLLLDQCGQLDDEGIDQLVQESKLAIAEAEAAQIELAERRSRGDLFVASPSPSSSDNEDGPAQHPVAAAASRTVSLAHLELNSCARVTLNGLASLALHPTLRSLSVSGRALFGVPEGGAGGVGVGVGLAPSSAAAYQHERNIEAALAQIEQLSDARIVVNGGKRARRKAARKRRLNDPSNSCCVQ